MRHADRRIFAIVLTGGTITAGDEIEEEKP